MANTSYRIGRTASQEDIKNSISENKNFSDSFERLAQHLDSNGIDISGKEVTLGADLSMDAKSELFMAKNQSLPMN